MTGGLLFQNEEITKYIKFKITIEDNGVGISQQNVSRLFKDYKRLEEHDKLNAKGTGLGLSICKNIIEQMGGTVSVDSEIDKGTKFHIVLQLKAIHKVNQPALSLTKSFKTFFRPVICKDKV